MSHCFQNKKYLVLVVLPAIFWLFTNSVINWHYHQIYNGILIKHAHPYEKQSTDKIPVQSHHHSNVELVFLDLLCNPLVLLAFFFFSIGKFLSYSTLRKNIFNLPVPVRKFYNIPDYHAPPAL